MAKDLKKLEEFVKARLTNDKSGHDYPHIKRVLGNAMLISRGHKDVDRDILIAACLLHDISFKEPKTHQIESAEESKTILPSFGFSSEETEKIVHAIINHNRGFAKEGAKPVGELSLEAKILCDADRIDSLGAIGIFRQINFTLTKQDVPVFISKEDKVNQSLYGSMKYMASLADDMLTESGKKLAKKRAKIMIQFVKGLEEEMSWSAKGV